MASSQPRGAVLVGSVPLPDAEAVFRTVAGALGRHLRRLPDGETGARLNWFTWQVDRFRECPQLEPAPEGAPAVGRPASRGERPKFQLRPGVDPASVRFGPLGYAAAARESYALFARLKRESVILEHCRFQVCLPTPMTPTLGYTTTATAALVEPAYEAAMLREVDELAQAVPREELAIQWDCSWELAIWEGMWQPPFANPRAGVIERLARLGGRVPAGVELGYHLCYGDYEHSHWKQPEDTSKLVEVANAVTAALARPINWVHLPVPRDRDDDAYFAPLAGLSLSPETELYLGLVHYSDGVEGTRRRIAAANRVVAGYGVATECGWGRRAPETVPELLRIHAAVADPLA
jgi:hypothetical protein